MFSTKVVDCLCQGFRLGVKQNKGNPERTKAQILNMVSHYFGDHATCREYDVVGDDGNPKVWCGFHRDGANY